MLAPNAIQSATLKSWVRAEDLALSNGDNVATWLDQSGNGNNLVSSGPTNYPKYRTNQLNGYPAVELATDDFMTCDAMASQFAGEDIPFTLAAVLQETSGTAQVLASLGFTGSTAHFHYCGFTAAANMAAGRRGGAGDTQTDVVGSGVCSGPRIAVWRFNGTTVDLFFDGYSSLSAGALNKSALSADLFTIGCLRRGAGGASLASFLNAKIFEMALWKLALSNDEISQLKNYWNLKYFGKAA
jgi:hypothetical protein